MDPNTKTLERNTRSPSKALTCSTQHRTSLGLDGGYSGRSAQPVSGGWTELVLPHRMYSNITVPRKHDELSVLEGSGVDCGDD